MGYVADQKSQIHSEFGLIMPRLKSFAVALTGDEARSQTLLRAAHHHILARASRERGHTPLLFWSLMQTYRLWASRMQGKIDEQGDPRMFQPRSRTGDGGVSARFAMKLVKLPPAQRGALHLVYGERLSYDEVAEIFDVSVSEIIGLLSRSYAALGDTPGAERSGAFAASESRGQHPATQNRQGWAA
jgi:DNA-directed RNA polymerase specialized sigma24 family protein